MGQKAKTKAQKKRAKQTVLTPSQLIIRCFAENKRGVWQAFCLEFNLAVQGGSYHEVRRKMHEQIDLYLYDALMGEDKEFADQLLHRKAPLSIRSRYHFYKLLHNVTAAKDGIGRIFNEAMPLTVANHHA